MSSLDLNLFLVFLAVIEEGSTVAAARRLALSQSAISNALGRLRHALGDPLFVRRGRGLVPTPRAEALRPVVSEALGRLAGVLHERFTAASSTRTFTLACADHHQAADVPRVAAAFARRMPSACLRVVSVDYLLATDGLASGAVDAALAPDGSVGPEQHALPLFREAAGLYVRSGHPAARRRRLDLAALSELGHIDVHLAMGRPGDVNRDVASALDGLGFTRRVTVVVASFVAAASVAARTDHVAWLPSHAARPFAELLGLRALRTVLPPLELGLSLVWHARSHSDAGSAFFRALVTDVLRERKGAHGA